MADLSKGSQGRPEHGQRPTSYTPEQLVAIRGATPDTGEQRGPSSQAGLGSVRGPRYSVPSSPAPGQPGSRFNPNVVERRPRPQAEPAPGMITSADAPKPESSRQEQPQAKQAHAGGTVQGPVKVPLTQRAAGSKVGQAVQSAGLREGARRLGTEAMQDAAAHAQRAQQSGASTRGVAASAVRGAAVGAARGLHTELDGHGGQKAPQGSAAGADLVGRMGSVVDRGAQEQLPGTSPQGRKPVSERYDYQFEGQGGPEGTEQQRGA
ncbi:hypothetical protein M8J71_16360 [Pseudarthrobacter sp. R1]|uniref:hypothetical protein n=1 Tax=Pseudarthrobacter sp. R1 TaxID=2944934 RepID=UPI00210CCF4E|nr:hypothetical protein [Pseudarthrobacter sp. R1]MCQ6272045.1 hypothetical protein [Pseudarthrobacter sp. R1]